MKRIIFLSILAVFLAFLAGCGGQLLVMPEVHFSGNFAPDGYWYGVYRYPKITIVNNTKYTLCILVDGDDYGSIFPGQRLKIVVRVWPQENRQMSFVALAFDKEKYIGVTRPQSLTAYMSVNYNRSDAFTISNYDIQRSE